MEPVYIQSSEPEMSLSKNCTRFYASARVLCLHPIERWFVDTFTGGDPFHDPRRHPLTSGANMDKHKGSHEFISHLFSFSKWTDNTAGEP